MVSSGCAGAEYVVEGTNLSKTWAGSGVGSVDGAIQQGTLTCTFTTLTVSFPFVCNRLRHGFRSQQRCIKLLHHWPDRLLITGCFLSTVLHQNHFRKDWQLRVRTWFDQPGRKLRRRQARKTKAATLGVRPLTLLRPAVRAQTVRYNRKVREGRGFTLAELKEAGISRKAARGVGVVVDHRRRNLSEEGKAVNVERLKAYKARLIVFPRNAKKPKKGDSTVRMILLFKSS